MNELTPASDPAPASVLQELRKRQIQLEMENAGLRRTQAQTEAERKRYFDLYDQAPVSYCTLSQKGLILQANLTAATLLGTDRNELIAQPITQFILPEDQNRYERHQQQLFETGEPQTCEIRMLRRNTGSVWIRLEATAAQDADGATVCRVVLSDITERRRAANALRENNELFSLFMRHSPIYTFIKEVTPTESRVLQASDNFQQMIGIPGRDMVGMAMTELFPAEFAAKITADDWYVVAHGKVLKLDEDLNGRNYTSIKFPIVLGDRTLLAGYTIDITDRKQAEAEKEKLEALNRQLQKSESLGRMAGAIAHHFNNQLQAVMMSLELAMNDLPDNAGSVELLAGALESARKAAEVSSLMLAYLGQTVVRHEPIKLSATCQQSLSLLRAIMPPGVVLETDLPVPGPTINANENQIQQVLTNLVTNAWEASEDKQGAIRITVKTVAAGEIPARHRLPIDCKLQDQAYACLEVADAGGGIPDLDIEQIFDPFFTRKFTGRGMGLPVVLGLVRAHSGVITVESKLGQGSVFRVFLPVLEEAVARKPLPAAPSPSIAGGGTLLVVEDEPAVRNTITIALRRLGFVVLAAEDGVQALEIFQQHRDAIRCVLCDLTMPRMDGWETLSALRSLSPDLPVILASGYSEDQVMEGHHHELPQAFLGKPYELEMLKDTIARVLIK